MDREPLVAARIMDDEPMIYDFEKGRMVGVREALRLGKLTEKQAKKIWPEMPDE